jgi:Flp pilus assembly protein CpaB
MSGRRLLAILIGVIGLIVLLAVVVYVVTRSNEQTQVQVTAPVVVEGATAEPGTTPVPTVDSSVGYREVVVSLQTVPRGWQMTEAELTTDLRLATEVTSEMITNIEDAVGLYARQDIYQGETLTTNTLASDPRLIAAENYGPSSLVPPGWVAMAVPMDRLSGVGYGYAPGDSVDVLMTFTLNPLDPEFQTLLFNSATFFLQEETSTGTTEANIFVIDPYGRFEALPTGDLAHIAPSEDPQRPVPVSIVLQNARIVNVGAWQPPLPALPPTPTAEPGTTPTPGGPPPTPTPAPPDVVLVALPPQQQLFLKYAVETGADIDFALRSVGDGQLYAVDQLDISYLLEQFGINVPPNAVYAIGGISASSSSAEADQVVEEQQP